MTAMQILDKAIQKVKEHGYAPREGNVVVSAYKANELYNMEECLYVLGEVLTMFVDYTKSRKEVRS